MSGPTKPLGFPGLFRRLLCLVARHSRHDRHRGCRRVADPTACTQFNANFLTEPWQQGVIIIAVIAFSFVLSVLRFRVTQNFVNIVFLAYGGAILLIGLAGLLSIFGGHGTPVNYAPHSWLPTGHSHVLRPLSWPCWVSKCR